jgi:hypothetical protein
MLAKSRLPDFSDFHEPQRDAEGREGKDIKIVGFRWSRAKVPRVGRYSISRQLQAGSSVPSHI